MSAAPTVATRNASFGKLVVLMVTAFMDMVGVLMIVPLLPFYAQKMGAGGLVVGLLVSSFSVAQLLMAPVWGRFSDHYGRRPALIVGMTSAAIAYVIFAYANSLWLLFFSRRRMRESRSARCSVPSRCGGERPGLGCSRRPCRR
jgi:MFS family permease